MSRPDPAALVDHLLASLVGNPLAGGCGLTHSQVADLTDRQIADHYFHERDEGGNLVEPKGEQAHPAPELPPTPENYAAVLFGMGRQFQSPYAPLVDAWKKKFGDLPIPAPWNEGW